MKVEKTLETSLRVGNPLSFARDIKNNIQNMLNRDLLGRCFRGCYILSILEIIKYSDIMISTDSNITDGKVDVMFRVSAIIYYTGETITGVKVTHKDKGIVFGETPIAKVFLNYHKTLETVSVNDIISVRVGATQYSLYSAQVSVNGYPMLPVATPTVYKLTPVDPKSPEILASLNRLKDVQEQLANAKSTHPKSYEFFENLLYGYKSAPPPLPDGAKVTSVTAIPTRGWGARSPYIRPSDPSIVVYESPPYPPNEMFDGVPSVVTLIEETIDSLRTLAEMSTIYDERAISSHKHYWLTLIKSKLDNIK